MNQVMHMKSFKNLNSKIIFQFETEKKSILIVEILENLKKILK